ncbi:hypothetical protein N7481_007196 [Penicillium waksmanii]|uniref:uncharacterized protein n=1 Tax=Penicillium waksmanii TaxID=69791 RepID=UPI002548F7A5|nr:uncharacterized protein N7481_007196 [Penicillium waksmanii]KAJ5979898.1 hypothetical protein N7481_007196 [Penicillium waksmanii]
MSKPEDFSVGWICAIPTEYVAAQALLDETYEVKFHLPNNNNDYAYGRIGDHNVVISVLPIGEYGTAQASRVAEGMMISFSNLRVALMVGIGGGAPNRKHDIRLGDIVVSSPSSGEGGVYQYDFGKAIQGKAFEQTGFLNMPPPILRAAVAGLKAKYELNGHTLEETIEKALALKPRLRKKYRRPDLASDRLFRSEVVHRSSDEPCDPGCGDNQSDLVSREPRDENDDNPAIHYGLIASGNSLMKDAIIRDQFAAKKNILCFEMEAAGLLNHFPCLVIRGICDYSDSHKNKEWQGYAAMVAAAYAKDLLYRIPSQKVKEQHTVADTMKAAEVHNYNFSFGDNNRGVQVGWNAGSINEGQGQRAMPALQRFGVAERTREM